MKKIVLCLLIIAIVFITAGCNKKKPQVIDKNETESKLPPEYNEDYDLDYVDNSFVLSYDSTTSINETISYIVPKHFSINKDSSDHIQLDYDSDEIRCVVLFYISEKYKTYDEFLEAAKNTYNVVEEKQISSDKNISWNNIVINYGPTKDKQYITQHNNKLLVYSVRTDGSEKCNAIEKEVLNSIEFK